MTTTKNEFAAIDLYDTYKVKIALRDRLCGGVPKNPELIRAWIVARTGGFDDATTDAQTKEAVEALVDATTEKSWNGFPGDERGLFIWARQIKAMFKESGTMLRITEKKRGSKQIFQHGFEIKGPDLDDRVYLGVKEASGFDEGPIHVQTAQGPRTALKRVDYVMKPTLAFTIWVLRTESGEKRHVGETEIRNMITFAQENGLGADRSQGRGKFDVIDFAAVKSDAKTNAKKAEPVASAVA